MNLSKTNKNGSILLEVLLTIIVIAVGLTLVVSSYLSGYRAMRINADSSLAVLWLDDKMTELSYKGILPDQPAVSPDAQASSLPEKFKFDENIAPISGPLAGDISALSLSLSWKTSGKPSNLSLTTYLFNPSHDQ